MLPLDAFERTQLLSSVLMPRWVYRSLFVARDQLRHDIDMLPSEFVTTGKEVEHRHHALLFEMIFFFSDLYYYLTDGTKEGCLSLSSSSLKISATCFLGHYVGRREYQGCCPRSGPEVHQSWCSDVLPWHR